MNAEFELADRSGHSTHLDLCHAAIHKQLDAVDKAAVIGSEKTTALAISSGVPIQDIVSWLSTNSLLSSLVQMINQESEPCQD